MPEEDSLKGERLKCNLVEYARWSAHSLPEMPAKLETKKNVTILSARFYYFYFYSFASPHIALGYLHLVF